MSIKNLSLILVEDNSSDENWIWWNISRTSLDITQNSRQDLDWDEDIICSI